MFHQTSGPNGLVLNGFQILPTCSRNVKIAAFNIVASSLSHTSLQCRRPAVDFGISNMVIRIWASMSSDYIHAYKHMCMHACTWHIKLKESFETRVSVGAGEVFGLSMFGHGGSIIVTFTSAKMQQALISTHMLGVYYISGLMRLS